MESAAHIRLPDSGPKPNPQSEVPTAFQDATHSKEPQVARHRQRPTDHTVPQPSTLSSAPHARSPTPTARVAPAQLPAHALRHAQRLRAATTASSARDPLGHGSDVRRVFFVVGGGGRRRRRWRVEGERRRGRRTVRGRRRRRDECWRGVGWGAAADVSGWLRSALVWRG